MLNLEIRKKIMFLTNCSHAKINMKITDDNEFVDQFSYKYNMRIFDSNNNLLFKRVKLLD